MSDSQNYWTPEEMEAFMERRRLDRLAKEAAQCLRVAAARADEACLVDGNAPLPIPARPDEVRLTG